MDLKLLSWNVREMGNRDKRVIIHQMDIFCLQETKIQLMFASFVKEVWGPKPYG